VKRRTLLHVARATAAAGLAFAVLGTPAAMAIGYTTNAVITATPSTLYAGDAVTYTATITPTPPGGTVLFLDNGSTIGCDSAPVVNGVATCTTTAATTAGLHFIYGMFSGSGAYYTTSTFLQQPVLGKTTTVATASPKLADPGAAMLYTAKVTPRPVEAQIGSCLGGCGPQFIETVAFAVDGAPVADCLTRPVDLVTGIATCKTAVAPNAGGKHAVTATYTGSEDTNLLASTGTDDFDVTAPGVSLSTNAVGFGSVTVGASGTQTVTVTNSGNGVLHLADATAGGAFAIVGNTCAGATLAPGATCVVTLAFAPTAAGNATASLTVDSDAGTATAALSGTGAAAATTTTTVTPPTGATLPPNSKTTFTATTASTPGAPTSVTVPLRCPNGVACTLDGTVVISTSDLVKNKTVRAAAVDTQTVARFSGVRVAAGKVKQIKLTLSPSFIKSAQKRGIRLIHATLTVNTSFTDGTKATRQEKVVIRIPKPAVKKKAVVKRAPHFTG
jgi:Big-like domain-containing protein/HYDIN/CFA65/VesB family protein